VNRAVPPAEAPNQGHDSDVTKLCGGFRFTEGPTADADGNVFFSDLQASAIYKVDSKGTRTTFLENSNGCNGLAIDARGRLIACEGRGGRVIAIDVTTKTIDVVADKFNGQRFIAPNDLAIDKDGGVYFSDPAFRELDRPQDKEAVYYVSPEGKVTRVIDDQPRPNGVGLSPDGKTLYVLLSGRSELRAYAVDAPGRLGPGRSLGDLQRPGDGLAVDAIGNLYVTQPALNRVQVLSPDGKTVRSIRVPESPSNCTLGGSEFQTLFITARTSIYTVEVEAKGERPRHRPRP
jgi:gluconolactonase